MASTLRHPRARSGKRSPDAERHGALAGATVQVLGARRTSEHLAPIAPDTLSMPPSFVPLAGIASYGEAAHIGFSVDENVRRLVRFHWVERRLMGILIAHLTSEPVWEVKCAFALHQWQSAEHVEALRRRIAEMRNPVPRL